VVQVEIIAKIRPERNAPAFHYFATFSAFRNVNASAFLQAAREPIQRGELPDFKMP
jgi:hypothetical protein